MNEPAPKISDRDKAQMAMKHLMEEVLLLHRGNNLLQRTSCYRKLQSLAEKAGVELLGWIKLYTIENNPETVPISIPTTANSDTILAIETMTKIMECYSDDARKREVYLRRQGGYDSLIRFSFRAHVPLIEWIVTYYKNTYSIQPIVDTSTPSLYTCPSCNEPFKSADALKGHGPRRCQREKFKTVTPLPTHES